MKMQFISCRNLPGEERTQGGRRQMAAAVYLGMEHCFSFLFSFCVCLWSEKVGTWCRCCCYGSIYSNWPWNRFCCRQLNCFVQWFFMTPSVVVLGLGCEMSRTCRSVTIWYRKGPCRSMESSVPSCWLVPSCLKMLLGIWSWLFGPSSPIL